MVDLLLWVGEELLEYSEVEEEEHCCDWGAEVVAEGYRPEPWRYPAAVPI